jgi:aminopeptidase YwaD
MMPEFDGDNAYRILESIAHERLAATPGERKAAETLAEHLRGYGLAPQLEAFRMWTYLDDEASVEVLKPYRKTYEAAVVGLSGNTPPKGIECGFKYVEDASSQHLTGVAGKAILISGGLSYEKVRELLDKKIAALITASAPHRLHNRKSWRDQMRTRVGRVPSLDLMFDDAFELIKKGASRVRVRVKQDEREGTSQNVVAEIRGTEFPDEAIALTAHYDGISKSLGGHDNASGTAVMTEIARCLAAEPLRRTVRLVLCGGEESGLYGSRAYVAKHKGELDNFRLCVNCDIAGAIIGNNSCFVTGPDSLRWYLDAMGKEFGMGYEVSTHTYSSDNVPFSAAGVPACSITRGGGYCCEIHTSRDEFEDIDGAHLAITGRYILAFLRRVGNAVTFPFAREIADEMKKPLDEYVKHMKGEHYTPLKRLGGARQKRRAAAR